jgi:hypothetical protein
MALHHPMTRRASIKRLLHLSGSRALAGFVTGSVRGPLLAWAGARKTGVIVEGVGAEEG